MNELVVPPLGAIMAYRGVHALCTVAKETDMLRATHYATCLIYGREPVWGVWTVHGVFQRFFSSRTEIANAYPRLVWRKKQATWNLIGVHDMDVTERRKELKQIYKRGRNLANTFEPVAALFEDGTLLPWDEREKHLGNAQALYSGTPPVATNTVEPTPAIRLVHSQGG
jgi:hypothetical protein